VISYEYPLSERIRTLLRLEDLYERALYFIAKTEPQEHHVALLCMFEILEVAGRADLKSDLLQELERQKQSLESLRDNPDISQEALDNILWEIDRTSSRLFQMSGKVGQELRENEWLMSIRSRISIPGGTCEFDLPAYYAWQQHDAARRRGDLLQWVGTLMPLAEALQVLLGLLRESGTPQHVVAVAGQYSQSLPAGRIYQLMRVRIDKALQLVPEISGHRLMMLVRLMRQEADGRLRPSDADSSFELTLCA